MISVSSSELGLGFIGIGEEDRTIMEESDFEEESTHSYVSCVDPDVALSYIDEKIENVLGHFQKDFEGGVSAENLGAKFGGYGSFLAMYQRSPICSSIPKSPLEAAQNQTGVRPNSSFVVPEVSISGSASKPPASSSSTSDVLAKLKKFEKTTTTTPDCNKQKSVPKTSSSGPSPNHKTLRLRIKVGSSDLSSLKNNDSKAKNHNHCLSEVEEGLLHEIGDSPTKIIMAMVSFPFHKDQLLSPLSDELIQLGLKETVGYVSVNKSDSKSTQNVSGVPDAQKCVTGKFSSMKKEKLKERVKHMPQSKNLDGNHIVSSTEKEIDKVLDSYVEDVEGILRGRNNIFVDDAVLMSSKPDVEDSVAALPDLSVKETESVNKGKDVYLTSSLESKSKREKAPSIIEHVDCSTSVDKVSQSEIRKEEQISKSKRRRAQKSTKSSSSAVAKNSLVRGKDAADKLQESIGRPEDVYKEFFGDLGEEEKQSSSTVLKATEKEKVFKQNALKESFKSEENDENRLPLVCEPVDSKYLIKSSNNLNEEDRNNNSKQNVKGGTENLGMEPEKEISGTCKKPKTGKSRFSGSNKTTITEASASKAKDIAMPSSSRDGSDERKRKHKEENKENGDCMMRAREAVEVMEDSSSGEKVRKQKQLKGSLSCDGKEELPFSFVKDKRVDQENGGRDSSASHLLFTVSSSPSICKDLGSDLIKTNVHEAAKGSGRISEKDEHHDADSNGGNTLKRSRDGEGYNSNIDKPETTTKKASEINDLLITGKATQHSLDKERSYDENGSIEKRYKPKKSRRYREENNRGTTTVNEVQEESRSKKRPPRKESMESGYKEESREQQQDPNTKLDSSPPKLDRAKTVRGKSNHNHLEVNVAEKSKNQVQVLGHHDSEVSITKKQITRNDNHIKQNGSRQDKDNVGPRSSLKKEPSTSQAASDSIKEATALKHMADRLTNGGSNHESTSVYFQAALKFLRGASLWESSEHHHLSKSIVRTMNTYCSTAKLCEFCAHEYEKNKDMGAAALAYKCMEVAYLRIIYLSHGSINRSRHELQAALQLIPPSAESPSFGASDGENPNNLVISSGNNSSVSQLLAFSQNVSLAMDASRKAQIAFASAKAKPVDNHRYSSDGIASIKRALDFTFQDIDKLLHVVRLAMESINR